MSPQVQAQVLLEVTYTQAPGIGSGMSRNTLIFVSNGRLQATRTEPELYGALQALADQAIYASGEDELIALRRISQQLPNGINGWLLSGSRIINRTQVS